MTSLHIMEGGGSGISNDDIFHQHRMLIKWTTEDNNGFLHPDVRIAYSPNKGFHIVVAEGKTIEDLTRITSSPMASTLSVLNALDIPPFSSHGPKFPPAFLKSHARKPEILQSFFLMDQYLRGNDSWWAPYIKTLPTPEDVQALQFHTSEDQSWLEGTNLKAAFVAQATRWQGLYIKGLKDLQRLNYQNDPDGKYKGYSWDLFRWAATIFGSRSFTSEVLCDTEPAEQARLEGRNGVPISEHEFLKPLFVDRFAVLLPLLDILNHRPIAQVEWQARASFIGMQVLSPFTSGEEICNNYGPRDNESLLLSYGFTIPSNPFDHVAIALRPPPPGSPLAVSRKDWKRASRSSPSHECYIFNPSHPRANPDTSSCFESSIFSYDLLDTLSILKSNDRELQTMYHYKETHMSWSLAKPHRFEDFRNLLAVVSQLYLDCKARAERLSNAHSLTQPSTSKHSQAKIYRDSQAAIVETAEVVCKFILVRACSDTSEERVLSAIEDGTSTSIIQDFKTLLNSHSVITSQDELFSVARTLEFLPDTSKDIYHKVLSAMEVYIPHMQTTARGNRATTTDTALSPTKRKRSPNQPESQAKQSKSIPVPEGDLTTTAAPPSSLPPTPPSSSSLISNLPTSPLDTPKTQLTLLLGLFLHLYLTGIPLPSRLSNWLKQLTSWYPPDDTHWNYVPTQGPWAAGEEPPGGLMWLLDGVRKGFEDAESLVDARTLETEIDFAGDREIETKTNELSSSNNLIDGDDDANNSNDIAKEQNTPNGVPTTASSSTEPTTTRALNRHYSTIFVDPRVSKWLLPKTLCWAWNVMEEEGVVVAAEIMRLSEDAQNHTVYGVRRDASIAKSGGGGISRDGKDADTEIAAHTDAATDTDAIPSQQSRPTSTTQDDRNNVHAINAKAREEEYTLIDHLEAVENDDTTASESLGKSTDNVGTGSRVSEEEAGRGVETATDFKTTSGLQEVRGGFDFVLYCKQ